MHSSIFALSRVLPIARWSTWPENDDNTGAPKLGFIEPMLRRRLSGLAKISLHVAHECAQDLPRVRFVYASRHGEIRKTTAMLEDLADGEPLSPTAFSLSVLNASAGLFSILRQDSSPATAISAAEASFGFGLLEACAQFESDRSTPVLFVYSDEPAPAVYGLKENGMPPHAIALLLREEAPLHIQLGWSDAADSESNSLGAQSLSFLDCLRTGRGEWLHAGRRWTWDCVVTQ